MTVARGGSANGDRQGARSQGVRAPIKKWAALTALVVIGFYPILSGNRRSVPSS
jgi:hypothetical protein